MWSLGADVELLLLARSTVTAVTQTSFNERIGVDVGVQFSPVDIL